MRCLYCNKRLSLLKLAKGDSFCSPDHFDQYQLQLSKDAFDRLKSGAVEETKTPLVFRASEGPEKDEAEKEEAEEMAVASSELPKPQPPEFPVEEVRKEPPAPATRPRRTFSTRKSITARPPQKLIPEPDPAMARVQGFGTPPEAPFAISPLPPWPPTPEAPLGDLEVASEADAPKREVAFPVHTVEVTACILNLYLHLNASRSAPVDWKAARSVDPEPEAFAMPPVILPVLALAPEFPQYEAEQAEEIEAPAEPVDLAAAVPVEIVEVQEPVPALEQIPTIAPPEMVADQLALPISLELKGAAELPPAAAVVESPIPVSSMAEKPHLSFSSTQPVSGLPEKDEMLALPVNGGLVPAESLPSSPAIEAASPVVPTTEGKPALSFASMQPISPLPFPDTRVAFLMAPSYRERQGNSSPLECAASLAPNPATLTTSFNSAKPGPLPLASGVAQGIGHLGTASLKLHNSRTEGLASENASQMTPILVFSATGRINLGGWREPSKALSRGGPPLESSRIAVQFAGFIAAAPGVSITRPVSGASLKNDGQGNSLATHPVVLRKGLPSEGGFSISLGTPQPERPTPDANLPSSKAAATPFVSANPLCLGTLQKKDLLKVPIWRDFPAQPAGSNCPVALAGASVWEEFDPGIWSRQTHAAPLPASITNGAILRAFPLHPVPCESPCRKTAAARMQTPVLTNSGHSPAAWQAKESGIRQAEPPENILSAPPLPTLQFFQPPRIAGPMKIAQGEAVRIVSEYPFLPAQGAISGALEPASQSSAALPKNGPAEAGLAKVARCSAAVTWEPQPLVPYRPLPLKFLPVRKNPILPTVRNWQRLPAPPR